LGTHVIICCSYGVYTNNCNTVSCLMAPSTIHSFIRSFLCLCRAVSGVFIKFARRSQLFTYFICLLLRHSEALFSVNSVYNFIPVFLLCNMFIHGVSKQPHLQCRNFNNSRLRIILVERDVIQFSVDYTDKSLNWPESPT